MPGRSLQPFGFEPSGGGMHLPWKQRLLYVLGAMLLIGLVVRYAMEIQFFQRTIDAGRLILWSALIGAAVGAVLAYRLQRHGTDSTERVQIAVAVVLSFVLFAPLFGSLSNRWLGSRTEVPTSYVFIAENPYAQRFGIQQGETLEPDGYYLFVRTDREIKRFPVQQRLAAGLERGDTLQLPMRQGLWGYPWLAPTEKPVE